MKNVVLGTINNYSYADIEIFINSFLKHNNSEECDLVLFASDFTPETIIAANSNTNIKLIRANFAMKRIDYLFRRNKLTNRIHTLLWYLLTTQTARHYLLSRTTGIMVRRFVHYYNFLRNNKNKYRFVFLTDIRDVLWQSALFSSTLNHGLHVFMEDPSSYIGCNNDNNYTWLIRLFGKLETETLRGRINSCAGTILGDTESTLNYLAKLLWFAGKKNAHEYGDDQAIHNYIIHNNLMDNIFKHENESGPVLTMCDMPEEKCVFGTDNKWVNKDKKVVPILHHYDRYPNLLEIVKREYAHPNMRLK
jgi:hypothetical protein